MTPAELEAIRARNAARTPGAWKWCNDEGPIDIAAFKSEGYYNNPHLCVNGDPSLYYGEGHILGCGEYNILDKSVDGIFIAHASEDIPALLAEVERLRRALMSSRLVPGHTGDLPTCIWQDEECGCWRHKHNAAIDAALRGEV